MPNPAERLIFGGIQPMNVPTPDQANSESDSRPDPGGWNLIDLPHARDSRGSMTFIEHLEPLPFKIKRVYYILDVAPGATRGHHAHRAQEQIIIALSGEFTVHIDNGLGQKASIPLGNPHQGLLFGPMHWHHLSDFSAGAVCLILSSCAFKDEDYIRDHGQFMAEFASRRDASS